MLANYLWTQCLTWSVIAKTSGTPLKKTDFLFPSRHQLQIAYWIGVELHTTSPSPSSGFFSGLNLCRSCIFCQITLFYHIFIAYLVLGMSKYVLWWQKMSQDLYHIKKGSNLNEYFFRRNDF